MAVTTVCFLPEKKFKNFFASKRSLGLPKIFLPHMTIVSADKIFFVGN